MSLQEIVMAGLGVAALVLAIPIGRMIATQDYHAEAGHVSMECLRRLGLR